MRKWQKVKSAAFLSKRIVIVKLVEPQRLSKEFLNNQCWVTVEKKKVESRAMSTCFVYSGKYLCQNCPVAILELGYEMACVTKLWERAWPLIENDFIG